MSEAIGCTGVWKSFGEVIANRDVSLSVRAGEVHAVIGENGAGKSTLMRALYGLSPPDRGEVRLRGQVVARPSVAEALERGVGMVHQHFMLVPTLSVVENVVLGREPRRGGLLDLDRAAAELEALGRAHHLAIDPRRRVSELSVGEAQRVEIVKVLWRGAEVLILDEPTAVLTPPEVEELERVLRGLAQVGKTVVLVTHKLDEVLAVADRVTVLRRGEVVAERETKGATAVELARAMVGRDVLLADARDRAGRTVDPEAARRLVVKGLAVAREDGTRALDGIDLEVRRGEILGVAGVEGNGQHELGLALAGVLAPLDGQIVIDGHDVTAQPVRARQQLGLAHVPDDRHARGLLLELSVEDNLLLGLDERFARGPLGVIDRAALREKASELIARYDVRPAEPTARAGALSGGNQQKIVVGRELERAPAVLVCAQPTRGVDVGAIERIHDELLRARDAGAAVLLISAELDEILALSDRICVLYRGRIAGTVENAGARAATRAATRMVVGALMLGAEAQS